MNFERDNADKWKPKNNSPDRIDGIVALIVAVERRVEWESVDEYRGIIQII